MSSKDTALRSNARSLPPETDSLFMYFCLEIKVYLFFFCCCCFQIGGCFPGSFLLPIHIAAETPHLLELVWAVQSTGLMELRPLLWGTKLPPSFPTLFNFSVNFPTADIKLQGLFYPTAAVLPPHYLQTASLCTYRFSISAHRALVCFGSILNNTSPDKAKIIVFLKHTPSIHPYE